MIIQGGEGGGEYAGPALSVAVPRCAALFKTLVQLELNLLFE